MSETGLSIFQQTMAIVETFIYAGCLLSFFFPLLSDRKKLKTSILRKSICIYFSYIVMSFAGMYALNYGWVFMIGTIMILSILSGVLELDRNFVFLLSIIFFYVYRAGALIANSLFYLLNVEFVTSVERTLAYRNLAYIYVAVGVIEIILTETMLLFVRKKVLKKTWNLHWKELCYLSLFPIIGLVFGEIVARLLIIVKDHVIFGIYEQYPIFLGMIPLIAILFYLGMIVTILSYQQIVTLQEEKKKYFVEQQQLHALQERIEEVDQFYKGIRQIKHEMKNHLANIKGLAGSGKYEDMEQYITQMDSSISTFELTIKTGNSVTDVIVNDKKKAADKLGIKFQSDFFCPQSDKFNVYDIGIILNNLLTNALEACEKMNENDRYITLSSRHKRKFFLIEVKNTFEGEIEFDTNTGLPVSTKQNNNSLHGIGLSNVKSEVEKYLGDVDIGVKKNEFYVTVLLQEHKK